MASTMATVKRMFIKFCRQWHNQKVCLSSFINNGYNQKVCLSSCIKNGTINKCVYQVLSTMATIKKCVYQIVSKMAQSKVCLSSFINNGFSKKETSTLKCRTLQHSYWQRCYYYLWFRGNPYIWHIVLLCYILRYAYNSNKYTPGTYITLFFHLTHSFPRAYIQFWWKIHLDRKVNVSYGIY
mgnify:CR=1 FL=1